MFRFAHALTGIAALSFAVLHGSAQDACLPGTICGVQISASPTPSYYGDAVTFTLSVASTAMFTGAVTFTVDEVSKPPIALSDNKASFTTANLSVGQHLITGSYDQFTDSLQHIVDPPATTAQLFRQQGPNLIGSGIPSGHVASVALSEDGNTALIGVPDNTGVLGANYVGGAWVFTRSGGTWSQQTTLVGSNAIGITDQGISVALSADGSTALTGRQQFAGRGMGFYTVGGSVDGAGQAGWLRWSSVRG